MRIDDIGASSKRYEIYSRFRWRIGPLGAPMDWLFLKYLPGLRAWGPYKEISSELWNRIALLTVKHDARLTIGVTAAWADDEQHLIPYHEKFPEAAAALKQACRNGLVEIANHGLTHCVVEGNRFKPRLFSGNRRYHREFSPLVSEEIQQKHIYRAQDILQNYFDTEIVTFIPPGKDFMDSTLDVAEGAGLKYVCYDVQNVGAVLPISILRLRYREAATRMELDNTKSIPKQLLRSIALEDSAALGCRMLSIHDRDVVLNGLDWFDEVLRQNPYRGFQFARDTGRVMEQAFAEAYDA